MNTQDFRRKPTLVFCADVAGLSRLMSEDPLEWRLYVVSFHRRRTWF
jgi:hypothetical protein